MVICSENKLARNGERTVSGDKCPMKSIETIVLNGRRYYLP